MNECYYVWCKWHCGDEPFCCSEAYGCEASAEELAEYEKRRLKLLGANSNEDSSM